MALIHTHIKKRKAKKPDAKARELASEWEKLMKKYEPKNISSKAKPYVAPKPFVRETQHVPSLDTGYSNCAKKEPMKYTGTNMLGVGQMHKSNAVPIFSKDDAVEISRMRRG
jgi:hypothetical protein